MIKCACRLLPLSGTGTLPVTQKSPLLGHCLRQKGYLTDGKKTKNCQVPQPIRSPSM
jgi:hypothetical protein